MRPSIIAQYIGAPISAGAAAAGLPGFLGPSQSPIAGAIVGIGTVGAVLMAANAITGGLPALARTGEEDGAAQARRMRRTERRAEAAEHVDYGRAGTRHARTLGPATAAVLESETEPEPERELEEQDAQAALPPSARTYASAPAGPVAVERDQVAEDFRRPWESQDSAIATTTTGTWTPVSPPQPASTGAPDWDTPRVNGYAAAHRR